MLKNTKAVVGSVFLALGLLSNGVYGSMPRKEMMFDLKSAKSPKEKSSAYSKKHGADLSHLEEWQKNRIKSAKTPEEGFVVLEEFGVNLPHFDFTCRSPSTSSDLPVCGGQTVLYRINDPDVMKKFLEMNIFDINSQDELGNTVLHFFVILYLNELDDGNDSEIEKLRKIIKMLIKYEVNLLLKNLEGKTARQILVGDLVFLRKTEKDDGWKRFPEDKKMLDEIEEHIKKVEREVYIVEKSQAKADTEKKLKEAKEKLERDSQTEEKHPQIAQIRDYKDIKKKLKEAKEKLEKDSQAEEKHPQIPQIKDYKDIKKKLKEAKGKQERDSQTEEKHP